MIQKSIKISDLKNNTGQIKGLPKNPRILKDHKFEKLVKSIQDDPEMLDLRELIVYDNNGEMVVICGNMRLKAMKELKYKDAPCKVLPTGTDVEKLKAYTIKDNVSFGEHDFDILANEWDVEQLEDWGLDIPNFEKENNGETYSTKVESPIYTPKGEKPKETDLYNLGKYYELIDKINSSNLSDEKKLFLQLGATRHIEFNYSKIAEYYSHEDNEVQDLIEDNAMVIIDYHKAIELGFVKLFNDLEILSEIDE